MLSDVRCLTNPDWVFDELPHHVDRLTRDRLADAGRDQDSLRRILSTARFPAGIPLHLAADDDDAALRPNRPLADGLTLYLEARAAAAERLGRPADDPTLQIGLELGPEPVFVAWLDAGHTTRLPEDAVPPPLGQSAAAVRRWIEARIAQEIPAADDRLETARAAARAYALRAAAPNTLRAYRASIRAWCAWSERHALPCLPARGPDIAAFLAAERGRGLTPPTLDLRRAALTYLHRLADCPVPTQDSTVVATQRGIRRAAPKEGYVARKKRAAVLDVLQALVAQVDTAGLAGVRDRALLLIGFVGAMRRSELAAIRIEHVTQEPRGLAIALPDTKGERTGKPVTVAVPFGQGALCPVRAYFAWLELAGIAEGPVFRRVFVPPRRRFALNRGEPVTGTEALSDRSIARIIQHHAARAGYDPAEFGGHSLKRGALTTGMQNQVHPTRLKHLGRHKSYAPLDHYLEHGDPFEEHPLKGAL
ncbi:tyrosine-type recombinase/integrase [Gluconacetobacter diazotrophicus]|uniref:Tyrosine-type recombinase/integrase n=1 Tax=Gluconacetobacter diazotrophicus TaxID=33996 RepID=A0A7W4I7W2_GLUDI|nr:tyrosine-type recombinase/integrase [Gluconacetobacter diazotrophicus]MBB2157907.1 tyrosine-type recombinase/integrase [Gluconacetobacter diazotrophicus]